MVNGINVIINVTLTQPNFLIFIKKIFTHYIKYDY
jgi:hypothetical protein